MWFAGYKKSLHPLRRDKGLKKASAVPPNLTTVTLPTLSHTIICASLGNGGSCRQCLLSQKIALRFLTALTSPFDKRVVTALPATAALWKQSFLCTRLVQWFVMIIICEILLVKGVLTIFFVAGSDPFFKNPPNTLIGHCFLPVAC